MNSRLVNIITGFLGTMMLAIFVVGLAKSIAEGFAGFDGALPFIIIVAFVLCLAFYDFFDQCIRKRGKR